MTGKKRLQVLANYLKSGAVDKEQFDMTDWPKCAIGEGSCLPSLAKDGLNMSNYDTPEYHGWWDYEALEHFFHIPLAIAEKLFGPTKRKPETVARQIEEYLND